MIGRSRVILASSTSGTSTSMKASVDTCASVAARASSSSRSSCSQAASHISSSTRPAPLGRPASTCGVRIDTAWVSGRAHERTSSALRDAADGPIRLAFSISSSRCRFRSLVACFQSQAFDGLLVSLWLALPAVRRSSKSRSGADERAGLWTLWRDLLLPKTTLLMLRQARWIVSRHDTRRPNTIARTRARRACLRSSLSCILSSCSNDRPTPPLRRSAKEGPSTRATGCPTWL
jgi:hypothetical protein